MSDSSRSISQDTSHSSRLRTEAAYAGRFVRRHWMWGVVLVFGYYLWQDIHPDVDLPSTGPPAPDFTLERMNGEPFRLSDHRGEVVVLNVWATWCPPCRVEIPGFAELQRAFADRGLTLPALKYGDSTIHPPLP